MVCSLFYAFLQQRFGCGLCMKEKHKFTFYNVYL